MEQALKPLVTVVAGDIIMEWNLARSAPSGREPVTCGSSAPLEFCWQRGGASLLADLLGVVASDLSMPKGLSIDLRSPAAPTGIGEVSPKDPGFHHSFAIWTERKIGAKPPLDREKVWRVEEFLGIQRAASAQAVLPVENDAASAGLVVLQDSDLGFRQARDGWPAAISAPGHQLA